MTFYDATNSHQLADLPGAIPAWQVANCYPWVANRTEWVLANTGLGFCDWEPWVTKRGPLDPRAASLADIAVTHLEYYQFLDGIRLRARKAKLSVGVYGWFDLSHANHNWILQNAVEYSANVKKVAYLKCYGKKSFRDLVKSLGGANWTPNYLPDYRWNNETWGLEQYLVLCERKANALHEAGVPSIPLIWPYVVTGPPGATELMPVIEPIVRAWVHWAKSRYKDQWGVWCGDAKDQSVPEAFKECLK